MTVHRRRPGILVATGAALLLSLGGEAAAVDRLLIRDVTLVDGSGNAPLPGVSVLVEGERISRVLVGAIEVDDDVQVVDGTGRFLTPGLIDTHVHIQGGRQSVADGGDRIDRQMAIRTLHGYLYSGVTSVYDSGNNADFIFALREDERSGALLSPRIFATGQNITAKGGYADNEYSIAVVDIEQDRARLQAHFDRRPDLQKVLIDAQGTFGRPALPIIDDETLRQVIAMAHASGIPTTAHVTNELEAVKAMRGGIDAFAHPVRAAVSDGLVQTLRARRISVSTTLSVFHHIALVADDPSFLQAPLYRATIEPEQLEFQMLNERERYIRSGMSAQFRLANPIVLSSIKRMHDAGVVLALGTDRTWGASVHMELELLAQAGIPAAAIVRIATLNAASYLGRERDLGSIERGKLADMLLLRADPTVDVAHFQQLDAVFKGGRQIDLGGLDLPVNRATGF